MFFPVPNTSRLRQNSILSVWPWQVSKSKERQGRNEFRVFTWQKRDARTGNERSPCLTQQGAATGRWSASLFDFGKTVSHSATLLTCEFWYLLARILNYIRDFSKKSWQRILVNFDFSKINYLQVMMEKVEVLRLFDSLGLHAKCCSDSFSSKFPSKFTSLTFFSVII